MTTAKARSKPSSPALHITRLFDAPRELVFRMWAEPQHMSQWSCPHGFVITRGEMDFRPGGTWSATMRSPQGEDLTLGGVYRQIVKNERIVFTHAWLDGEGNPGPETLVAVSFAGEGKKTRMTFDQTGFDSEASRNGHEGGWSECFERLATYLAALQGA